MMHWGGGFGLEHGFGWMFMILFWVLIILVTVYLVKAFLSGKSGESRNSESAREILAKRYAGGEISKEEFEEALEILKRNKG